MKHPKRFTLTNQHIALLRRAYVGWQDCETGAPEIDPKRPYGNSNVVQDVAEILEILLVDKDDYAAREAQVLSLLTIHEQTATALQIVLCVGEFCPGVYERPEAYDMRKWVRVS